MQNGQKKPKHPNLMLRFDLSSREKFFDLLRAISSEKTLIIVTHEIDLAVKYAEHIICIKEGRKIIDGTPSNFDKNSLRS